MPANSLGGVPRQMGSEALRLLASDGNDGPIISDSRC